MLRMPEPQGRTGEGSNLRDAVSSVISALQPVAGCTLTKVFCGFFCGKSTKCIQVKTHLSIYFY